MTDKEFEKMEEDCEREFRDEVSKLINIENICPISKTPCEDYNDCDNRNYCHLKG